MGHFTRALRDVPREPPCPEQLERVAERIVRQKIGVVPILHRKHGQQRLLAAGRTIAAHISSDRPRADRRAGNLLDELRAVAAEHPDAVERNVVEAGAALRPTGLTGALIYVQTARISPDAAFSVIDWTAYVIFIVVIGGIGTIEGPIVGVLVGLDDGRKFLLDHGVLKALCEPRGAARLGSPSRLPFGQVGVLCENSLPQWGGEPWVRACHSGRRQPPFWVVLVEPGRVVLEPEGAVVPVGAITGRPMTMISSMASSS